MGSVRQRDVAGARSVQRLVKGSGPERGGKIFPRHSIEEDVERELRSHLALRTEELETEGWTTEHAAAEARRLLGDQESISGECARIARSHERSVRRGRVVEAMLQDLRYGVRTVLANPGFAVVAVITLALGIGANTAIFSVVNGVLLQPLPFADAEELVDVREARAQGGTMSVAWPNFVDWHEQNSVFEALFAYSSGLTTVLGGDLPVSARVGVTTRDMWSGLGVTPVRGRLTTSDDHVFGAAPVVLVSERFWQTQLGERPLDGVQLDVNGLRASVVGVLPSSFDFPTDTDVWQPLELSQQGSSRSAHNWSVVGRLADGVEIERAREEIDGMTRRIVEADGSPDEAAFLAVGAAVRPLHERVVGTARTPLLLLLGAAALVLLVACTNLASTLLARGANRARELAVRASLGAGQGRLVRQLVTESVVIAAGGALVGVALGTLIVDFLKQLAPAAVPRLDEVAIDPAVLFFTAVVAAGTVLLFGLFPALRLTRSETSEALRSGSRGNADGGRGAAWTALVATEVALALVLLVGSGLLVRSFQTMLAEDPGFDPTDVVSTRVALSRVAYPTPPEHAELYRRVVEELSASPAVSAAGVLSAVPLAGSVPNGRIELDGDLEKHAVAEYIVASSGALEALDIPLVQGRHFDDRTDTPDQPHVAIVSESFVREYWPNENPIGRQVTGGGMDDFWQDRPFADVVGVVGDVRYTDLGSEPVPTIYFPYSQRPFRIQYGGNVVVEAAGGDPASVGPILRETIQGIDPNVPVTLATQRELIGDSMAARQFTMLLLAGFSVIALLLAVVGIYGVVSYSVAQRTREMGIRLALGAAPGGVLRLVMGSALRMVIGGLVLGVIGALAAGRVMQGLLYEIAPTDPISIVVAVVTLGGAALLASWVPARGGTRVDPMVTMRAD